jgi:hypothetical protein
VWCLTKVITFDSGRVGRIQEYVRNARARLFQMLEPHAAPLYSHKNGRFSD